jgi:hypothetical protein
MQRHGLQLSLLPETYNMIGGIMEILKSIWFNEMGNMAPIGVVIIKNDIGEERAYIGTGWGQGISEDEKKIAERGAKFPIYIARLLIFGEGR